MAARNGEREDDSPVQVESRPKLHSTHDMSPAQSSRDEDDEDDEEEAEPHLKYTKLTAQFASVYRKDDSTSACLASGDKLIIGTHSGNVHVLSLPSLRTIKLYRAHSASITSISVSPYHPAFSGIGGDSTEESLESPNVPSLRTTSYQQSTQSPNSPKYTLPPTPANSIHIATSSIDGHVCVSSLVDPKDVTLRNFARPLQAVALSPEYKYDRAYISGGLAGNLVLTTGARPGVSSDANTNSAAAAASGWLGQIGLSSNAGKDTILHSGEGSISSISWSLTGKYVAWVNEHGIKILRSSSFLAPADLAAAWSRIGHIDKPNRRVWHDMAGVWKAKAQWVNTRYLDNAEDARSTASGAARQSSGGSTTGTPTRAIKLERMLVGWGDTVWIIDVEPKGTTSGKVKATKSFGKVNVVHQLKLSDGIVSGLSLYTPSLLLTLIYRTRDDDNVPVSSSKEAASPRGIKRRQNGMPPEMRLISLESADKEELELESLVVGRYQSLAAADYHLSTVFFSNPPRSALRQRGTLGVFGDGLWDVSVGATSRLLSSSASVLSSSSGDDRASGSATQVSTMRGPPPNPGGSGIPLPFVKPGLKVFVVSPFDCLLGVKRDLSDHLGWLVEQGHFQQSWELLNEHPEICQSDRAADSRPETPSKSGQSLGDFFDDDGSSSSDAKTLQKDQSIEVKREKRRIGDLWLQQLTDRGEWGSAGTVAEQTLDISVRWEHWIDEFMKAGELDHIAAHMPARRLKPPISPRAYATVLMHYIDADASRVQELLTQWNSDVFDIGVIVGSIQQKLEAGGNRRSGTAVGLQDRDRRILQDCLASLYVADGRPAEALKCYMHTRNADPVIQLVRDNQLYTAVANDIFTFITIRLSSNQLKTAPIVTLDSLSSEPIDLLVNAASQNLIPVSDVVKQLRPLSPTSDPYLYFYFRALWTGDASKGFEDFDVKTTTQPQSRRSRFTPLPPSNPTRQLLAPYANLTVSLFAEYNPSLLAALLRASDASIDADPTGGSLPYTFEHASDVCKSHGLTSELVYLLAATGQTREALHLIIDEIGDVHRAIQFAREVDDKGLWNDLLQYSLSKPPFILGLLEEVGVGMGGEDDGGEGAAIDPITLVSKIPEGLEIQGLKGALSRIVADSEVQCIIAKGAARVLQGEVALALDSLTQGRARGIAFDVEEREEANDTGGTTATAAPALDDLTIPAENTHATDRKLVSRPIAQSRRCAICDEPTISPDLIFSVDEAEQGRLLGYPCGHTYHLGCLLDALTTSANKSLVDEVQRKITSVASSEDNGWVRSRVGAKVARMQMISGVVGDRPCLACERSGKGSAEDD